MYAVGHAYWIGTQPLPIEIIDHTNPWATWSPVAVAVLVALIALGGVIWNIKSAAKQEHRKWRRETVLRIGTEALAASVTAVDEYTRLAHSPDLLTDAARFEPAHDAVSQIQMSAAALRLLGAEDAAAECTELRDAFLAAPRIDEAVLLMNRTTYEDTVAEREPSDARKAARLHWLDRLKPIPTAQGGLEVAIKNELTQLKPGGK